MLRKFIIAGVKNIAGRAFDLKPFAVLVGQASRGKTSVLDGIRLLLGCATGIESRGNARILPFMRTGETSMTVQGTFDAEPGHATPGTVTTFERKYTGRDRVAHTFKKDGAGGTEENEGLMKSLVGDCIFDTRTLTDFDAIDRVVSAEAKVPRDHVARQCVVAILEAVAKVPAGVYDVIEHDAIDTAAAKLVERVEALKPVPVRFVQVASYMADTDSVDAVCQRLRERRDEADNAVSAAYTRLRQANAEIESRGAVIADTTEQPGEALPVIDERLEANRKREAQLAADLRTAEAARKAAGKKQEDKGEAEKAVKDADAAVKKATDKMGKAEAKVKKGSVSEDGLDALRAVAKNKRLCEKCRKTIAELVEESDEDDKARTAFDQAREEVKTAEAAANKARGKLEAITADQTGPKAERQPEDPARIEEQLTALRATIAQDDEARKKAVDRDQRKKQIEQSRIDAVKAKAERAAMQGVVTAIEAVWAGVVKVATAPFILACNYSLDAIKTKVETLRHMGVFSLDYTGGKMRFAVERDGEPVLYHTMGGTERVVVRNIVGSTVLEYRIASGAAKMGILLDDIAEVSDEALVPFVAAMVDMTRTKFVQCVYATCHGSGDEKEKALAATGAQIIRM